MSARKVCTQCLHGGPTSPTSPQPVVVVALGRVPGSARISGVYGAPPSRYSGMQVLGRPELFWRARSCVRGSLGGRPRRGPDVMSGPVRAFAPTAEVRGGRWGPDHPVLGSRSASSCVQVRVSNVGEGDGRDFRPLLVTDRPCARRDRTADRNAADPGIGDAPDWGSWTVGMGLHACGTVCDMSALPTPGRLRCL